LRRQLRHLDPAADRCSTEVAVESRQQLAATVTLKHAQAARSQS
jgi:hypothetical protein